MQLELLNDQGQATSKFDAPDTVFARHELKLTQQDVVFWNLEALPQHFDGYELVVRLVQIDHSANHRRGPRGVRGEQSTGTPFCFLRLPRAPAPAYRMALGGRRAPGKVRPA